MTADLRPWGRALIDVLFPPACVACRVLGREPFCEACAAGLEPSPPVPSRLIDDARAVWAYGGPVARALQRLKYGGAAHVARPLGAALRPIVDDLAFDAVVPVPLGPARQLERGFNQARELARAFRDPVDPFALVRGDGPAQVGRSEVERRANLEGLFVAEARRVAGRRILLVDDVVTTGATASTAAAALRRAGVVWVGLAVVAATPLHRSADT